MFATRSPARTRTHETPRSADLVARRASGRGGVRRAADAGGDARRQRHRAGRRAGAAAAPGRVLLGQRRTARAMEPQQARERLGAQRGAGSAGAGQGLRQRGLGNAHQDGQRAGAPRRIGGNPVRLPDGVAAPSSVGLRLDVQRAIDRSDRRRRHRARDAIPFARARGVAPGDRQRGHHPALPVPPRSRQPQPARIRSAGGLRSAVRARGPGGRGSGPRAQRARRRGRGRARSRPQGGGDRSAPARPAPANASATSGGGRRTARSAPGRAASTRKTARSRWPRSTRRCAAWRRSRCRAI
jgi:hypothetical protein